MLKKSLAMMAMIVLPLSSQATVMYLTMNAEMSRFTSNSVDTTTYRPKLYLKVLQNQRFFFRVCYDNEEPTMTSLVSVLISVT